ncbi:NHLP leader peptide family RiPP precursor [Cohnella hashimotonis]|uniref:NHLP leader peptide family RiPP n=1 Tax=Cohnella hashimotonis TaxID=2826895 RepID=A0ABT6TST5_9BACL|nr:NHLP leader peptide family RiPP precursor [Cohnella hashimotonis]MDI4649918.1 NHLP leader peptide family RiPP precursor [Cohnella hashimotonis]
MSLESLKVQVIKKAWEDPAFKQQLLADPKAAVKDAFGVELPQEIQVTTVEETASHYYLVIPPNPEDIAGGNSNVEVVW